MSSSTIVLITGANSGIGYATAKLISSEPDYHVIMACRDTIKGQEALAEIEASNPKGTLSMLQLDVTNAESINAGVSEIQKEFGRVDVFISNAGISAPEDTGSEKLRKIFATNVTGAFTASEGFVGLLLKSERPYLIQISSGLGSMGLATDQESIWYKWASDEYRMSKAALNMATIQQHKRLESQNVRVFAYCPGLVRSNLRGKSEQARTAGGMAGDPIDSARGLFDIIQGRRDADVGRFVYATGIWPW
ncbi:hypothetical protein N7478_000527 [Penicillium angulare]|uniref:uncharacterized protein n=1 Tax=Penicillium angulare TaxID=116970 RepID=UPI00254061FC|nr:uncharacterized protein N7478_000527 [Penicillium angulare]KAJ5291276.1 hypothetical protein N7478_000527 [Penicillium angulare]